MSLIKLFSALPTTIELIVKVAENLTKPKVAVVVITVTSLILVHQISGDITCYLMSDKIGFETCLKTRNDGIIDIIKELF